MNIKISEHTKNKRAALIINHFTIWDADFWVRYKEFTKSIDLIGAFITRNPLF